MASGALEENDYSRIINRQLYGCRKKPPVNTELFASPTAVLDALIAIRKRFICCLACSIPVIITTVLQVPN
jgi:hypothetical protein